MPYIRQTNFSAGELSPSMWGRSDSELYGAGLRTAKNFFINRQGNAVSRPGSLLVRRAKYDDWSPSMDPPPDDAHPRLVPFVYSDSLSYVLEFGHGYLRIHRIGRTVLGEYSPPEGEEIGLSSGPTTPGDVDLLELPTQYSADDVRTLQWAQVGATLYTTVDNGRAYKLSRSSAGIWRFDVMDFALPGNFSVTIPAQTPGRENPLVVDTGTLAYLDADHPPQEWQWMYSTILKLNDSGRIVESKASLITHKYDGSTSGSVAALPSGDKVVVYPDAPVTIRRNAAFTGTIPVPSFATVVSYNFFRGRGGLFGFVGNTKNNDFIDEGRAPDYTVQPLMQTDPFAIAGGSYQWPSAVAFFQERLCYGGTERFPELLKLSATGNYVDFDPHILPVAGQSIEAELASRRRERVRWLSGQRRLMIGTNASIWSFGGTANEPLDFDSIEARIEDNVGANGVPPLEIGGALLFVRNKGRGVRALESDGQGGMQGVDISSHAQHLFVGDAAPFDASLPYSPTNGASKEIVDWTYAEDPDGVIWAVRADGVLLSLTLSNKAAGWTRHETNGFVVSVCAVPETTEDAVYIAVQRGYTGTPGPTTRRYFIERMTSRVRDGGANDDICLDSSIQFKGAPTKTFTGLSHLNGYEVWAIAKDNAPQGPYTVASGAVTVDNLFKVNTFDDEGDAILEAYIGLPYTCDLETLDTPGGESRTRQKTVVSVSFELDQSQPQSNGLYAGQDFDHLVPFRQRTVADGYNTPSAATSLVKVPVRGTWEYGARAVLRQTQPLPVTVLGLVREVDLGG